MAVDTWGCFVFVNLSPNPRPVREWLGDLPQRLGRHPLHELKLVRRAPSRIQANWKLIAENFMEYYHLPWVHLDGGYHVNTVHPALSGVLDYKNYRTEIAGQTSVQISPLKPADPGDDAAVGAVRTGSEAMYWFVFPNFMLNLYEGMMDTNLVLPLGPDRCRVVFDFYFAQTEGPEAERFMTESMAVADRIQQEDMGICEEVQRGLASRSFHTGRFSVRREAAGYRFHQLLARRLLASC